MSKETLTVTRSNFASRLLSKAMSECKPGKNTGEVTTADAAKYAAPAAEQQKETAKTS